MYLRLLQTLKRFSEYQVADDIQCNELVVVYQVDRFVGFFLQSLNEEIEVFRHQRLLVSQYLFGKSRSKIASDVLD